MDNKQIDSIIGNVVRSLQKKPAAGWKRFDDPPRGTPKFGSFLSKSAIPTSRSGLGVFKSVPEAFDAAKEAFEQFQKVTLEKRYEIIRNVRKVLTENVEEISKLAVEETGLGRYEDKIKKNMLVINKTPGPEILKPDAFSGDHGLMITEPAPYGVIGSIAPVTNPSETIINNGIGMIAAGNTVLFNAHPSARRVSLRTLGLFNAAVVQAGGPAHLLTSVLEPSIETATEVMNTKGIRLLVVTGGAAVVRAAFACGKKVIAAGPGNPPVVVDETADIQAAARGITMGASLDNNVICTSEKEVLCVASVIDSLLQEMQAAGCYLLNKQQASELRKVVLAEDRGPGKVAVINRECIGKNASVILAKIGIHVSDEVRLAIYQAEQDDPLLWTEQLMPVHPVAAVRDCEEGIDLAVRVEHGFRHTASMWSRNIDMLSEMARRVNTSIFIKNGPNYAGLGFGGEGYTSFTIASPTGEGLTTARNFSRYRRCSLVDHFRIV